MADTVTVWQLITSVFMPMAGVAVGVLWRRIESIGRAGEDRQKTLWAAVDALKKDLVDARLEAERRFANTEHIATLREELLRHLTRIEKKLDQLDGVKP
jgi:uncharacterized membrane-anchored protein YhcB (DUF1043 family)